jgi:hypothetical protein
MGRSRHGWVTQVAPALAALAILGSGSAALAWQDESFGWVWATQTTTPVYTPDALHQYNSFGGINQVVRLGVGHYNVFFAGLGGINGGNVQASASGLGSVRCKTAGWQTDDGLLPSPTQADMIAVVNVLCFQGATPADSAFFASYEAIGHADPGLAYTYFDPSVTLDPDPTRSWDVIEIDDGAIGAIKLAAPVTSYAMEHVTADGDGPEFCNFLDDLPDHVTCWDPSGASALTSFSWVKGLGRVPASVLRGAFAIFAKPPSITNPIARHNSFAVPNAHISMARTSKGLYTVSIPGAASGGANALVHVTAFAEPLNNIIVPGIGEPVYCKPVTWNAEGADVLVQVACFRTSTGGGTPADEGFTLSYVVP